uniref:Uncharacterized protein n=1 Tax=Sphaerodactylus townsendi TaxID=933632 RepID=A0ACB8FEQ9_9SAUR
MESMDIVASVELDNVGSVELLDDLPSGVVVDSEDEVLELPKTSRLRLTFAEDAHTRDPPDLSDLEEAVAMPLDGARASRPELMGATALPAVDARRPLVSV